MRANKLQALLIFRSQGSFSQLLVHKKCARLTTVKTCSVGPWLSTVMLPGFQRILLGTTLRKDAGNMTSMVEKEKKLASNILNFQAFRENDLAQLFDRNKEVRINTAAGFLLASILISLFSERIVCYLHVDHQGDPLAKTSWWSSW